MDKQKQFLGARIEPELMDIVDKVSEEKKIDRTAAIKILINTGWKKIILQKALDSYKDGMVSVDKAAKIAGITISEMMDEIAKIGIKSDETMDEYRQGIKFMMES